MKKISLSIGALQDKYGDKEALHLAKEIAGADAVDFSLDLEKFDYRHENSIYSKSEEEFKVYFSELRAYAEDLGLEICMTHGRVQGFKNNDSEFNEALIKNAALDCFATYLLGAPYCVIHGATTIFNRDVPPEQMRELNFDMFCKMLPFAKKYGIKIATETFGDIHGEGCDFFGNIDEFIKTYERICSVGDNADYFTACVDTGHSNKATRYNNPLPADVIRMLGNRVSCLHLNDNNTKSDQHLIPFVTKNGWQIEGTIDWDDTFSALEEIGYSGYYNMELDLRRYGEEVMPEMGRFAVTVLRNALKKRVEHA